MKIGIIGTSHAACIKSGYDLVSDDLGHSIEVEFFATGTNFFKFFEQEEDGVLRAVKGTDLDREMARRQAVNINGKDEINLSDFDAVCVVGAQTGIDAVFRLIAQVDIGRVSNTDLKAMTLISSSTLAGIQSDLIHDALQSWPLKARDGQQQFLMPSPFPFEKFLDPHVGKGLGERTKKQLQTNSDFVPTVLGYIESARGAFSEKCGVTFLDQPEKTISKFQIISDDAYCHGAMRIGGDAQPVDDFTHANPEYGALFWQGFTKTLGVAVKS